MDLWFCSGDILCHWRGDGSCQSPESSKPICLRGRVRDRKCHRNYNPVTSCPRLQLDARHKLAQGKSCNRGVKRKRARSNGSRCGRPGRDGESYLLLCSTARGSTHCKEDPVDRSQSIYDGIKCSSTARWLADLGIRWFALCFFPKYNPPAWRKVSLRGLYGAKG